MMMIILSGTHCNVKVAKSAVFNISRSLHHQSTTYSSQRDSQACVWIDRALLTSSWRRRWWRWIWVRRLTGCSLSLISATEPYCQHPSVQQTDHRGHWYLGLIAVQVSSCALCPWSASCLDQWCSRTVKQKLTSLYNLTRPRKSETAKRFAVITANLRRIFYVHTATSICILTVNFL